MFRLTQRNLCTHIKSASVCPHFKEADSRVLDGLPYEKIPGPKAWPGIGNAWRMMFGPLAKKDLLQFHNELYTRYGDICAIRNINRKFRDMVFLFSPTDIEKFFRNESLSPFRESFECQTYYRNKIRPEVFGRLGVVTTQGEDWYNFRKTIAQPYLNPKLIQHYLPPLNSVSDDFITRMKMFSKVNKTMPENFLYELHKWAFEATGVIAFDKRFGLLEENPNQEAKQCVDYTISVFNLMMALDYTFFGKLAIKYNLPLMQEYIKIQDFFTDLALKHVTDEYEKIKLLSNSKDGEQSIFKILLGIDKKVAVVAALEMLGVGIDTVGVSTANVLYFLSTNKESQNKLRNELMELMPTADSPVTKDVINNAQYLKAVIKEALRLLPFVGINIRTTTDEIVLGGYTIPAGVDVHIPHMYISMKEQYYKRPTEFIPERWLKTTTDELSYKHTNPFVTLPFGYGLRSCIGKRFANMEMEIIVAKIIRNFHLEWNQGNIEYHTKGICYEIKNPLQIDITSVE